MNMTETDDLNGIDPEEIWQEAERIRRLRPSDQPEDVSCEDTKVPEKRLVENVLKQAVDDLILYTNSIVDFASLDDWFNFMDPDRRLPISKSTLAVRKEIAINAIQSLGWVMGRGNSDAFHFSFHECVEAHSPEVDVDYIRESMLYGTSRMVQQYPRVADGLIWAKRFLDGGGKPKYRRFVTL